MSPAPGAGLDLRRALPWLVLTAALVLATLPTWRPLIFGTAPALEDVLTLRCRPW